MRTLDATLQAALDSGNFSPIVRAAILDPDDYSVVQYLDVIYFRLNGIDLDIEFYDSADNYTDTVSLERGALIGGVEYTIFSGIYHLGTSYQVTRGRYVCTGSLVEPGAVNVPADVSYETLIRSVIDIGDMVSSFKNDAADWLDYQFYPDGLRYASGNIYAFFAFLKQKYLVHCCDNGINSILFFSAADSLALASQYTISLTAQDTWSIQTLYRQFTWKDENKTLHTPGPAGYVIHNLGYLESTASPPNIPANIMEVGETCARVIPNLKYQSGDCVKFDPGITGYTPVKSVLDVTEIFDARGNNKNKPAWYMELRPLAYFTNTSGGVIPTSVVYTSAYIDLATFGFSNNLDSSVTDVQKLADYLDDLDMCLKHDNLSGLTDAAAARTNLGLGSVSLIGNGTAQYQFLTSGANPYAPAWSDFFISGTAGGKTALAVTNTKTLTLTCTGDYNLTIPATGTAALLGTANVFTKTQVIAPDSDSRPLVLKAYIYNQTSDLFAIRDASDSYYWFRIAGSGQVYVAAAVSASYQSALSNRSSISGTGIWMTGYNAVTTLAGQSIAKTGAEAPSAMNSTVVANVSDGNTVAEVAGMLLYMYRYDSGGTLGIAKGISICSPGWWTGTTTNSYALFIDDQTGATNNYASYTKKGLVRFGDQVKVTGWQDIKQFSVTGYDVQDQAVSIASVIRVDTADGHSAMLDLTACGSGSAGDGGYLHLAGATSTTAAQSMARLTWDWVDATHASRKAQSYWSVWDTSEREGIRIEASGSAAKLGVLGAVPVLRHAHIADASDAATVITTCNHILSVLEEFGFIATA